MLFQKKNEAPFLKVFFKYNQRVINSILKKVAINMLKQKLDDSLIKSVTDFSQDDLNKLKNKILET